MDEAKLAAVIRRAQQGERPAFDELVDAFAGRVWGLVFRLTGSREDAEDLLQEVFLRVVRTIAHYQHDGRFEHWLLRIATNLTRDRLRRTARTPKRINRGTANSEQDSGEWLDEFEGRSESVEAGLVRNESADALNSSLAQLSEGEREIIMLRHFSQMSFKEIAELMDIPIGTALARAHRGLAKLRELMTRDAGDSVTGREPGALSHD